MNSACFRFKVVMLSRFNVTARSLLRRLRYRVNADAQDQGPDNLPHLSGIAPCGAEIISNCLQRIAFVSRNETLRRRPRLKVAQQMIEIPLRSHFELRRIDLLKWEWQIGKLLDKLALRRPERPDHFIIVSIHDLIDLRSDL